jgi:hypothetical protein
MAETFKHKQAELSTTNTAIYTCPSSTTAIVFLSQVSNKSSSDTYYATLSVSDSSATTVRFLAKDIQIPAVAAANLIGGKLVLEAGDSLNGYAQANGYLDFIISVLEIT